LPPVYAACIRLHVAPRSRAERLPRRRDVSLRGRACTAEWTRGVFAVSSRARGSKFLRGYQQTDAAGRAQFTTVYPGWYSGRAVHLHFKVRNTSNAGDGIYQGGGSPLLLALVARDGGYAATFDLALRL